ncbi:MAG TPA: AAA family ATPase [Candidatus Elarobacter sp.]|jgi:general secretion pathway protein A|nr:AAA family ATPase [Candidatus Elarobacter sp.]
MTPYYRHFGLERDPFLDTADPHFYRTTPDLTRVRERLVGGVLESRGLQVVVGDPGTGKTSLMAQIERELLGHDEVRLGKILDPSFASETEFLLGVARSFGLALPPRSPAALKNALKNFLYDAAVLDGLTLALLIDEAQNASDDIFEVLRLLLNYDVPQRKLLNVVLYGQTELRPRLDARRNLADRVDEWYELGQLDDNEARALIAYRVARAGGVDGIDALFDPEALAALVAAAAGTPRRLLTLAHATLREAAAFGRPRATRIDAEAAARSRRLAVPAGIVNAPAGRPRAAAAAGGAATAVAVAGPAAANGQASGSAADGEPPRAAQAPWWRFPWLAALWPR